MFDDLTQLAEEQADFGLAVCCVDRFIPWTQMHALYLRCVIRLKDMRGSGMRIVVADEELNRQYAENSFPNIDEIALLWEMIKTNNLSGFRAAMEQGLKPLSENWDKHSMRMHPCVMAIGYLLTETAKLYAPQLMQSDSFGKPVHYVEAYDTCAQWLEDVLAMVERILSENETSNEMQGTWLVEKVNAYIQTHYDRDITLTMLSEQMHYSPSYLSRYYKSHTGVNVMSYLCDVRILKAKEMLAGTNLRISEIARVTGFGSAKYFSRVFKKQTGVMPAQYRNAHGSPSTR